MDLNQFSCKLPRSSVCHLWMLGSVHAKLSYLAPCFSSSFLVIAVDLLPVLFRCFVFTGNN
jgi:hypothetical protein